MELHRYEATGNTFFILHLPQGVDFLTFKKNKSALSLLAAKGKEATVDSVMVLTGNPENWRTQGYHVTMDVFEPHAYHEEASESGWSTMCGNGVRGVAQYIQDNFSKVLAPYHIQTGAGLQTVEQVQEVWRVHMGQFASETKEIARYVPDMPDTLDAFPIIEKFVEKQFDSTIRIGFHYSDTALRTGEPHLAIFANYQYTTEEIVDDVARVGKHITNRTDLFPEEINTSIASIISKDDVTYTIDVIAATYERHIYYVTEACGTAATVIGSFVFDMYDLSPNWKVRVHMPGGILSIEKNEQQEYMLSGSVGSEK